MSVSIWNATEQKLEQVGGNVNINDSVISEDSTFSSKKITDSLVDLENEVGNVYSTEETVCGKWIDGKPIYRKVYVLTTALTLGTVSLSIENPYYTEYTGDIEEIVSFTHNPVKGVPYYEYIIQYFIATNKFINVATQGSTYVLPIGTKFIMEYTKTTD